MARHFLVILFVSLCLAVSGPVAFAHCDTMDGPVVKAAQKALETGNANLVLIWLQPDGEAEVRALFEKARRVRELGAEAKELADMYFLETVVRVHRASEGVPYTGLRPAGTDIGKAIPAADRAIEKGDLAPLAEVLTRGIPSEVKKKFDALLALKVYKPDDVKAGRACVQAYIAFVHAAAEAAGEAADEAEHHHHD